MAESNSCYAGGFATGTIPGADPTYTGPNESLRPFNARAVTTTHQASAIVGSGGNSTSAQAHIDSVKNNMLKACQDAMASGREVVAVFEHDEKYAAGGSYPGSGIDVWELRAMLEVVQEMGGIAMSHGDYYDWLTARANPVATPRDAASDVNAG